MRDRDMTGSSPDIVVHESITCVEIAVQDKVKMVVHQRKRQNNNIIGFYCHIDAVHAAYKVGIVIKHNIDRLAVRGEMPAIPD